MLVQTVRANQVKKAALCASCAAALEPEHALDALELAIEALRARAHTGRCANCKTTLAHFKETGRFGCPSCYDHFRAQVETLLPRVHAGATRHRGKTPGRV